MKRHKAGVLQIMALFFLLFLLLGGCGFQGGSGTGSFTVEDRREYTVTASPGEEKRIGELTFRFPDGFSGSITVGRITSGPLPTEPGRAIWLEFPRDQKVQLVLVGDYLDWTKPFETGKEYPVVLKYDQVTGSVDDGQPRERWVYTPSEELSPGRVAFELNSSLWNGEPRPQTALYSQSTRVRAGYFLGMIKPSDGQILLRATMLNEYRVLLRLFLAALPADLRARVEENLRRVGPDMIPPIYHGWGNFYQGFRYLTALVPIFSPRIYINLTENDLRRSFIHEVSHFFVHMLVGDEKQARLEQTAPGSNHALTVVHPQRSMSLIEEYAYTLQAFFGQTQGLDKPHLFFANPGEPLLPDKVDMPRVEGFMASLLILFAQNPSSLPDIETREPISLAPLGGSWEKVFRVIAEGHTNSDTLTMRLQELAPGAFALMAATAGWRYKVKGKLVDSGGKPISDAYLRAFVNIRGNNGQLQPYYFSGEKRVNSDGTFSVPVGFGLPGDNTLEIEAILDSTRVPVVYSLPSIEISRPTNKPIDLGEIRLDLRGSIYKTRSMTANIAVRALMQLPNEEPFWVYYVDIPCKEIFPLKGVSITWTGTSFSGTRSVTRGDKRETAEVSGTVTLTADGKVYADFLLRCTQYTAGVPQEEYSILVLDLPLTEKAKTYTYEKGGSKDRAYIYELRYRYGNYTLKDFALTDDRDPTSGRYYHGVMVYFYPW